MDIQGVCWPLYPTLKIRCFYCLWKFPKSGIAESEYMLIIVRRDLGLQKLFKTLLVPALLQSSERTDDVHSFPRDLFFCSCIKITVDGDGFFPQRSLKSLTFWNRYKSREWREPLSLGVLCKLGSWGLDDVMHVNHWDNFIDEMINDSWYNATHSKFSYTEYWGKAEIKWFKVCCVH